MAAWTVEDIPSLSGRSALVTGANSGIGFQVALQLAGHGATVVLACRDRAKAEEAADLISHYVPGAVVDTVVLDLADLSSVAAAADRYAAMADRLDILVNNAGVMATPERRSADGFELQLATNHLGHFALTGRLLDLLLTTAGARVVTVSSLMHWVGRPRRDPAHPGRYHRWVAYGDSKLANLLFSFELERRLAAVGADASSLAAHPGWTRSNLAASGPTLGASALRRRAGAAASHLGQPTNTGALPVLYAATAPEARGGALYGPAGPLQVAGPPREVRTSPAARNERAARDLFAASEALTEVAFAFSPASAGAAERSPSSG